MKQSIILSFTVLIFLVGLLGLLFSLLRSPADRNNQEQVIFVVESGESTRSIANRLEKEGLVRNAFIFLVEVKRLGLEGKIQAGDFRLSKSQSPPQIAQQLTMGTLDVWVQIIEGWRAEELAELLKNKLATYDSSWVSELKKHEGYLFPDTYLIPKDADIAFVIRILTDNFEKKLATVQGNIGKTVLSLEESIILASIVEREARFAQDRPIVAGILLNRLNLGMALQADATVQYALGYQPQEKTWWKKKLTKADLATDSPYNTYKYPGLPPKPIANPGLAALTAAIMPTETDYLYYLSDKEGHMHYAKTLEEHNENIRRYLN